MRGIAAGLAPKIEAVHPNAGIAKDSVKLKIEMLTEVFVRNGKGLAIPADTGFRVFITHCFVAVAMACFTSVRQIYYPVVRQIHVLPGRTPFGGIELRRVRAFIVYRSGFRQIIEVFCSATEVLFGRGSVAEGELPVFIHQDALANRLCPRGKQHCQKHCTY